VGAEIFELSLASEKGQAHSSEADVENDDADDNARASPRCQCIGLQKNMHFLHIFKPLCEPENG
jgi:hypothetical protein